MVEPLDFSPTAASASTWTLTAIWVQLAPTTLKTKLEYQFERLAPNLREMDVRAMLPILISRNVSDRVRVIYGHVTTGN